CAAARDQDQGNRDRYPSRRSPGARIRGRRRLGRPEQTRRRRDRRRHRQRVHHGRQPVCRRLTVIAMGAVSDIQLLSRCAEFTLSHSECVEKKILTELQTSAATPLVMGLRLIRLQSVVLTIGMFSLFESLLQTHMAWQQPFAELRKYL